MVERIVVGLGGSVFAPGKSDPEKIKRIAQELIKTVEAGYQVFVVVGGGKPAREYIETARLLGASETYCDSIGIDLTKINARLLIIALKDYASPTPSETFQEALERATHDKVVVMGGTHPGHTTTAVAVMLAEYVDADLFVKASAVGGVYTADPAKDPSAEKLDEISVGELIDLAMESKMEAGISTVFDQLAAKVLARSRTPTLVIGEDDLFRLVDVVKKRACEGTRINF